MHSTHLQLYGTRVGGKTTSTDLESSSTSQGPFFWLNIFYFYIEDEPYSSIPLQYMTQALYLLLRCVQGRPCSNHNLTLTLVSISQCADDTSFILDRSLESLYGIFTILDYYAHISGLNINNSTSKTIWIRSKTNSKKVYHHT